MRNINPLYVALSLVIILFAILVKLNSSLNMQDIVQESFSKKEFMVSKIISLKDEWDDNKNSSREIEKILKSTALKGVVFNKKSSSKYISFESKSLNSNELEYLINKLLNGTYVIKNLDIKRIDENSASIEVKVDL